MSIRMSSDCVGVGRDTIGILWLPGRTNPSLVIHTERCVDVLAHFKSPTHARAFAWVLGLNITENTP